MRGLGLGELGLGRRQPRRRLPKLCFRLLLPGPDLLVVERRDDIAHIHPVALSDGNLLDPSGGLGSDRRVVALDPPAHRDHSGGQRGRREKEVPCGERSDREGEQ